MIKNAEPRSISRIFTREANWFYHIPMYQRAFTWGIKECTTLFNDLIDNENGYFLGSIICVNSSIVTDDKKTDLQLIDGQQRITSLSLLLLAIYSKLRKFPNLTENQSDKLKDIKKELVLLTDEENDSYSPRLTLQIQDLNNNDYLYLLGNEELIENQDKPKKCGNRRIYKAFKCFCNCIDIYLEENDKIAKQLFDLASKINSAVMVFIEVDTNRDAYMLFESLNNRGIPLSAIDLIKNFLISIADNPNDKKNVVKVYKQWERIISFLGEDYSIQERFLRQYYNAFRQELNEPHRSDTDKAVFPIGYLATKSTLLDIYEKLIKYGYQEFLNDLEIKSKLYSVLVNNATEENRIPEIEKSLTELEQIQGAPSYILLLYIVANKDFYNISYEQINQIIIFLIKFFVRRNFTDYPNTRNLTKIFMETISLVRGKKDIDLVSIICEYLKTQSSSDDDFKNKLSDDVYTINSDSTRFLLCYYENKFSTKEIFTNLWERDRHNKYIWTIEHIFPEGENIPQSWIDMIANGDIQKSIEYRVQYTHKLGNLTLTAYNSNLSNIAFDYKINRTKDNNYIGYKNGLKLNEKIADKNVWTIEDIENRTQELVDVFLTEFSL